MSLGIPLIDALLYPKIHKKYPNFGIFTLEICSKKKKLSPYTPMKGGCTPCYDPRAERPNR